MSMEEMNSNVQAAEERIINEPENNRIMAKKDFSKLGFRLFFGTLALLVSVYSIQILVGMFKPEWMGDSLTSQFLWSVGPQYLVGMPLFLLIVGTMKKNKQLEKRKVGFGWFIAFFIIGYSLMMGANMIGTTIAGITGLIFRQSADTSYAVQNYIITLDPMLIAPVTVILAPILEELMFRKLIIDRTGEYGEAASALVSGLAFGLFHGNITQAVYAFVLGYFLALIYQKSGKIYVTIGIHMLINAMGSFAGLYLIKGLDYDQLLAITQSGDQVAMMAYIETHMVVLMLLCLFFLCVGSFFVAGIILLIVNRRRFLPAKGKMTLPRRSTFKTVIFNPGMLVYLITMIAYMVFYFIAS